MPTMISSTTRPRSSLETSCRARVSSTSTLSLLGQSKCSLTKRSKRDWVEGCCSQMPRSTINVTATMEVMIRAMMKKMSMVVRCASSRAGLAGGLVVVKGNRYVASQTHQTPHVIGPGRKRSGIQHGPFAKQAQQFADFVSIHLHIGDASIVMQAKFQNYLARSLRKRRVLQQVKPAFLHGGDEGRVVSAELGGGHVEGGASALRGATLLLHSFPGQHVLLLPGGGQGARPFVGNDFGHGVARLPDLLRFEFGEVPRRFSGLRFGLGRVARICLFGRRGGLQGKWLGFGNVLQLNDFVLASIDLRHARIQDR